MKNESTARRKIGREGEVVAPGRVHLCSIRKTDFGGVPWVTKKIYSKYLGNEGVVCVNVSVSEEENDAWTAHIEKKVPLPEKFRVASADDDNPFPKVKARHRKSPLEHGRLEVLGALRKRLKALKKAERQAKTQERKTLLYQQKALKKADQLTKAKSKPIEPPKDKKVVEVRSNPEVVFLVKLAITLGVKVESLMRDIITKDKAEAERARRQREAVASERKEAEFALKRKEKKHCPGEIVPDPSIAENNYDLQVSVVGNLMIFTSDLVNRMRLTDGAYPARLAELRIGGTSIEKCIMIRYPVVDGMTEYGLTLRQWQGYVEGRYPGVRVAIRGFEFPK